MNLVKGGELNRSGLTEGEMKRFFDSEMKVFVKQDVFCLVNWNILSQGIVGYA